MQSNIVYQLNCSSCQATYIGKTIRQMRRRLKEHGAQQPLISNPNDEIRCSARIAAKRNKTNLGVSRNTSDERNGDTAVSTKGETSLVTKIKIESAIERHIHETKHKIDWENWSIVSKDRNSYRLLVRESLAIAEFQPVLNATTRSVPLLIFPEGCSRRHNNMGKEHKENTKRQ